MAENLTFRLEEYKVDGEILFSYTITNSLKEMAKEARLCYLWEPDEFFASEMADKIECGLIRLVTNKEYYERYDGGSDGWGKLVQFAAMALQACRNNPKAYVVVEK